MHGFSFNYLVDRESHIEKTLDLWRKKKTNTAKYNLKESVGNSTWENPISFLCITHMDIMLCFFTVNGTGSDEWNWVEQMLVIATGMT